MNGDKKEEWKKLLTLTRALSKAQHLITFSQMKKKGEGESEM
jgi:hypothetical protein